MCLSALVAEAHPGNVDPIFDQGMDAVRKHQTGDGSYRYKPNSKQGELLTGAGVLCHQQWGTGSGTEAEQGVNWIGENVTFEWTTKNLYHHYYMGQAMFEYGGVKWIQYNKSFRDVVIENQNEEGAFAKGVEPKKPLKRGIRKHGDKVRVYRLSIASVCFCRFKFRL